MRLKGIVLTLVIILGLVFAVVNWQTLTAPLPIRFFVPLELPLGLILLITAVALSVLFFILAFFDRLGQLNQIVNLERQVDKLRDQLDAKRLKELERLEGALGEKLAGVEGHISGAITRFETSTRETLTTLEEHTNEHLNRLEERVLLVRNELAADIAETEDALRRETKLGPDEP